MAKRLEMNFEELEQNWNAKVEYVEKEVGELRENDTVIDEGTFDSLVNEIAMEEIHRFVDELPFWLKPIVKYFNKYYF